MYKVILILSCILKTFAQADWAETTLRQMNVDEKIGQLFIIPACPLRDIDHKEDLKKIIEQYHIGGIILKQADPEKQIDLIGQLQNQSKIPLLCVMDAEWGLAMRLQKTIRFPKNLTLGAIQDLQLLYRLGEEIGGQCRMVGAHVNFAPVVDVNINPRNPIIHMRSFGDDPKHVSDCAIAIMQGLQGQGILACAKHFPGHGDTIVDSHMDLPKISHASERLWAVELLPFKKIIDAGVQAVMTGHLLVPALEADLPATLSAKIITGLLKNKLGFSGLIFSDALNMKALANYFSAGEIAFKALMAGNDFLLYGDHIAPNVDQILRRDVPEAFAFIKKAYASKLLSDAELNAHVLKILKVKEHISKEIPHPPNLLEDLNSEYAIGLKRELYRAAITLVDNKNDLLPLDRDKHKKIALIEIDSRDTFSNYLQQYTKVTSFSLSQTPKLLEKLAEYSVVVFSINNIIAGQADFGIPEQATTLLDQLQQRHIPVVLTIFGTPYSLARFDHRQTTIMAYEDDPDAYAAAADAIFGTLTCSGKLPVKIY